MTTTLSEISDEPGDVAPSHIVHAAMHFLRVVRFRKSVMLTALLIAVLLGGLYYATAVRLYQSNARLFLRATGGDVLASSVGIDQSSQDIIPTHCQLIRSAVIIRSAIGRLPANCRIDLRGQPESKWVDVVEKSLSADAVRHTNIIDLSYCSQDPLAAAGVVHALIDAYTAFIDATHKSTAGDTIQVLAREKAQLEEKLVEKEAALLHARRQFGDLGIKPGGQIVHPLVQRAVRLNEALMDAREKRLKLQATRAAVLSAVQSGQDLQQHLISVESTVGREILLAGLGLNGKDAQVIASMERSLLEDRAEIKSLQQYYGPANPLIVEVADRIRMTEEYLGAYQSKISDRLGEMRTNQLGPVLTQMISQALATSAQQEASLNSAFEQSRHEAVQLNGDLAQLEILEHDVRRLRGFHDVLINQIANTDLKQEQGDIRVSVVKEPTTSESPVSPRLALVIAFCTFATLLVGGACVYVLDILDDRFRSPEELRIRLGVQVLAMVRQLDILDGRGLAGVQANLAPDSAESEAFRTLRTALALSPHESERVVVSSSEPGDGKTTVLVNLAVSCAQTAKRTLIIDSDLRRPGMTSLFEMKGERGLSDILRSEEEVSDLASRHVRHTDVAGLDMLASGPRPSNPSELLSGNRFADLIAWAETSYDLVLIDSPPVLAASDAQIIGRMVDGVVLVVHAEKNSRRVVSRAVDGFNTLGIRILGVVANRIQIGGGDGYGYGYGYAYNYGDAPVESVDSSDELAHPHASPPVTSNREETDHPGPPAAERRSSNHEPNRAA